MSKEKISSRIYFVGLMISFFFLIFYINIAPNTDIISERIMLFLLLITLLITIFTNLIYGLIFSIFILFSYATLILSSEVFGFQLKLPLNYSWMLSFPILVFWCGKLVNLFNETTEKLTEFRNDCDQYVKVDKNTKFEKLNGFLKDLEIEMAKAERYSNALSIFVIEILYFDEVVSIYEGDVSEIFDLLSKAIIKIIRIEDTKYRIDVKTFAVILPHTDGEGAKILKKRIKKEFKDLITLDNGKYKRFQFEIKIGLGTFDDSIKDPIKFKALAEKELEYDN